jgi:hypothetical protein
MMMEITGGRYMTSISCKRELCVPLIAGVCQTSREPTTELKKHKGHEDYKIGLYSPAKNKVTR